MARYVPIGERIALLGRRRGLSQAAVAGRLGKSTQWLSNIERGVRSADRYSILVPIAEVLRVHVADLTGDRRADQRTREPEHEAARSLRLVLAECGFVGALLGPDGGVSAAMDIDRLDWRVREAWMLVHEARHKEAGALVPELGRGNERAAGAGGTSPWDGRRPRG